MYSLAFDARECLKWKCLVVGVGRFYSNPDVVTKFVGLFRICHKV